MLKIIRPHKLFTQLPEAGWKDARLDVVFPRDQGSWLLDTAVLVALGRLIEARAVFEFGTSIGLNSFNLLNNLDLDNIYTIDNQVFDDYVFDDVLYVKQGKKGALNHMVVDSLEFETAPLRGKIDLVFIDGGHDYETVRSDTIKAFEMIDMNGPCVIAWHDYGNMDFPGVTRLVNEQSEEFDIFHVQDSLTAFTIFNLKLEGLDG